MTKYMHSQVEEMRRMKYRGRGTELHFLSVCAMVQEPPPVRLSGSSQNLVLLGFCGSSIV